MDWQYIANLIRGTFWNTNSWLFSIPAYLSVLALIPCVWPGSEGWKMKILSIFRDHPAFICMSLLMVSVILTSHSLYVNKKLTFATPDAYMPSVLQNQTIRIVELARENLVIRGKTFENCDIYGPAVIFGGIPK